MGKIISKFKEFFAAKSDDNLYRLDGAVSLSKAIPFGIQHVLSMFVANIAPLLIVFAMAGASPEVTQNGIRSAIFIAGLGTIIQLYPIGGKVGAKLPIVVGLSFTFVGVLGLVGASYGLSTMFLSIIVGGILIGVLGLFAKYWRKFIKPVASACVVLGIGLSLLAVGVKEFFGYEDLTAAWPGPGTFVYSFWDSWPYLVVAGSALLSSILFQIFVPGVWKNINILVGLVVGYLVALCFPGMINFSGIHFNSFTDFIDVPRPIFTLLPFSWGDFNFGAIAVTFLIYLVASTEGIGDLSSLASAGLGRDPEDSEIAGGLAADGFNSALAGCFGALPLTTFSQNVGIVGQTKVVNRFTIFQGALLLIIVSFFPFLASFLMTIPNAVLGGCMVALFASIVVIGMQMLSQCGWTKKNILIASLTIGIGFGITIVPETGIISQDPTLPEGVRFLSLIFSNPVANMFLLSLLLSYVIPERINGPKGPVEGVVDEPPEATDEEKENK